MSRYSSRAVLLLGLFAFLGDLVAGDSSSVIISDGRPASGHTEGPGTVQLSYVRCPVRKNELFVRNETGGFLPFDETLEKHLRGNTDDNDEEEYYHPCWCTEYYNRPVEYCPASLNVCVVYGRDGPVKCMSHSGPASLAQVFWPTGFFYVCIVLVIFCATRKGRYVWQYIQRKNVGRCCFEADTTEQDLLERTANRILAQEGRPHLLGEDFVRRERQRLQLDQPPEQQPSKRKKIKKPYSLKTKSFIALNDVDDDHEPECAICLGTLEDGEKVGDIPCGHLFHKDCLKTWLKRRKRCPLCQDERLLSPCTKEDSKKATEAPSSNRTMGMSSTDSETTSEADNQEPNRSPDAEEPSNLFEAPSDNNV